MVKSLAITSRLLPELLLNAERIDIYIYASCQKLVTRWYYCSRARSMSYQEKGPLACHAERSEASGLTNRTAWPTSDASLRSA